MSILLKAGAPVNAATISGKTPLHLASENGHLETVKVLINANASMDLLDNNKDTPLHVATQKGQLKVIQYLITKTNSSLKIRNDEGLTPLDIALTTNNKLVIQLLKSHSR